MSAATWRNRQEYTSMNKQQQDAMEGCLSKRESVFITGAAGTGKSFLISFLCDVLREQSPENFRTQVAITATTGFAADAINGVTLHSACGLQLGELDAVVYASRRKVKNFFEQTRILIIDEISMLSPDYFLKLDSVARQVRKAPGVPFGGIQVVGLGDFYQLPPVVKMGEKPEFKFCFQTPLWEQVFQHQTLLTQVYRQSDPNFVAFLQRVAKGELEPTDLCWLQGKVVKTPLEVHPNSTLLFARRRDADLVNQQKLLENDRPITVFQVLVACVWGVLVGVRGFGACRREDITEQSFRTARGSENGRRRRR